MITTQLRELVNQKLAGNDSITHNDIEDVLIPFYTIGDDEPTIDDDELHEMVTELFADFAQRGRASRDG